MVAVPAVQTMPQAAVMLGSDQSLVAVVVGVEIRAVLALPAPLRRMVAEEEAAVVPQAVALVVPLPMGVLVEPEPRARTRPTQGPNQAAVAAVPLRGTAAPAALDV